MDLESNQLSLEQEFMHQVFATKVKDLSYEETRELLIKFHKQMLYKDNFYRKLSRKGKKIVDRFLDN